MPQNHTRTEQHHHHTHTSVSHHPEGHHLLQVSDLSIGFSMYQNAQTFSQGRHMSLIIDRLSLSVHAGEILAIVGASGSGKTVLADAIMGLYEPNARVTGHIYFDGEPQTAETLRKLRGHEIAFVPQSIRSLNPLMRVGRQIGGDEARRRELYRHYRLPESIEENYPFELSGGMARRVLLCTALISDPRLIIADEPTPGLDLTLAISAMRDFREFADAGGGVLLITHDIELALRVADRIAVFKDGTVVEETSVESFADPSLLSHPFSRQLWHALPEHDFTCEAPQSRERS